MKKLLSVVLLLAILNGRSDADRSLREAMDLRQRIQESSGCSFRSVVTADYGEMVHQFTLDCTVDAGGDMSFTVMAPESISEITGRVTENNGFLTFDSQVLAFPVLADGLIAPVISPWLAIRSLRSGYIVGVGEVSSGKHIQIDDSYQGQTVRLDYWTGEDGMPDRCEIIWLGRRILSVDFENFRFM